MDCGAAVERVKGKIIIVETNPVDRRIADQANASRATKTTADDLGELSAVDGEPDVVTISNHNYVIPFSAGVNAPGAGPVL